MKYAEFVRELEVTFPELSCPENDLPHVCMGALVTLLVDASADAAKFTDALSRAVQFIERAASSEDPEVVNLVEVSFIESLHLLGPTCGALLEWLGPHGQAARSRYESRWGRICP